MFKRGISKYLIMIMILFSLVLLSGCSYVEDVSSSEWCNGKLLKIENINNVLKFSFIDDQNRVVDNYTYEKSYNVVVDSHVKDINVTYKQTKEYRIEEKYFSDKILSKIFLSEPEVMSNDPILFTMSEAAYSRLFKIKEFHLK